MGKYQFVDHDGVTIGAIMGQMPGAPGQVHWTHYFRVACIDTAITTIKAHGGQVVFGPQEVPGGDWIIHGIDPESAGFSLVGARAG